METLSILGLVVAVVVPTVAGLGALAFRERRAWSRAKDVIVRYGALLFLVVSILLAGVTLADYLGPDAIGYAQVIYGIIAAASAALVLVALAFDHLTRD